MVQGTYPADIEELLCTVKAISPATTRLAMVMHRTLASRLSEWAGDDRERFASVRTLTPELVLAANRLDLARKESRRDGAVFQAMAASVDWSSRGRLYSEDTSVCTVIPDWASYGANLVAASLGEAPDAERVISRPSRDDERKLCSAVRAVDLAAPELADEYKALIDTVVLLRESPRSATEKHVFGALFLARPQLHDPLAAPLALVHETGHHALALRQMFVKYLSNPHQLATHPLRSDARPLNGVLHAGFALTRMIEFLRGGALGVFEGAAAQLADQHAKVAAVFETLDEHADWTPRGAALFVSMKKAVGG